MTHEVFQKKKVSNIERREKKKSEKKKGKEKLIHFFSSISYNLEEPKRVHA